jgi:hypothetical protein
MFFFAIVACVIVLKVVESLCGAATTANYVKKAKEQDKANRDDCARREKILAAKLGCYYDPIKRMANPTKDKDGKCFNNSNFPFKNNEYMIMRQEVMNGDY